MAIRDILHAAFYTPMGRLFSDEEAWGGPLVLEGPPGGGKSSEWRRLARQMRVNGELLPFDCLKPGSRGEAQFGVTPCIVDDPELGMGLDFPAPIYLKRKFASGYGLLNVAELNTAAPAIQPPMLGLIQERELGVYFFGPKVRIFGDTNSTEDAAGGHDIPPAVANRCGWIEYEGVGLKQFQSFLVGGAQRPEDPPIDVEETERRVLQAWPAAFAEAAGVVSGFLKHRPGHLRNQPAAHDPQASRAWASQRTWEYATRARAAATIHGLGLEDRDIYVSAFIGNGVHSEMLSWEKLQDLPDYGDLLDGKVTFKPDPAKLDRICAVASGATALVIDEECENREARLKALWKLFQDVSEYAADTVAPCINEMWKHKLVNMSTAKPVLAAMEPVINAARTLR
jgi:hypothetical protein